MKKIVFILGVLELVVCVMLSGCRENEKSSGYHAEKSNNAVFVDAFFENIVSVELEVSDKKDNVLIMEEEGMQKIANLLAGLTLGEASEDVYEYYGNAALKFSYQDGMEKYIWFTSELISDGNGNTYKLEDGVYEKIMDVFR